MYNSDMKTLARFVQERREQVGLSVTGLAKKTNLAPEIIEEIESGKELFLPVTIRQNLAKGLIIDFSGRRDLELSALFPV